MESNMERVKHLSKMMRNVSTFFLWLVPISILLLWYDFAVAQEFGFFHRVASPSEHTGPLNYVLGFAISMTVAALVIGAIYHLRKFFIFGSEGRIFSAESGASLHKFSKYMILYSLLSIPTESLLGVVMTMSNPAGERMLSISLQPYDVTMIFLSFVFFAISWVFKESVVIAEENAQFV